MKKSNIVSIVIVSVFTLLAFEIARPSSYGTTPLKGYSSTAVWLVVPTLKYVPSNTVRQGGSYSDSDDDNRSYSGGGSSYGK